MPSREAIAGKLAKERAALIEKARAYTPADLERACTQSEDPDGSPWRPKDHLAHLAMIERAFQAMIRRHLAGESNPVGFGRAASRAETIARVHRNNEAYVDEHRADDLETLLAELDGARRDTLSLLGELTDDQLAQKVPGAPWADGTVGGILITNAYHEVQHLAWVDAGFVPRQEEA